MHTSYFGLALGGADESLGRCRCRKSSPIMFGIRDMTDRPVPLPDGLSLPFWEATSRRVLAVQQCLRCSRYRHPPGMSCLHCRSAEPAFTYTPVSGRAVARSWTIVRRPFLPGFDDIVPFMLVWADLVEQDDLSIVGQLLDGVDAPIRVGAALHIDFDATGTGFYVPALRLASMAQ